MNAYEIAANLLAQVQKAGARHSAKDTDLVQQMHDKACELGAKCNCEEMMVHPTLRAAVEALIQRHGTHDQKAHGRRHGVGGLREFAGKRGFQVRQGTDKGGKAVYTITDKTGKTKMRAASLGEGRKLITSARKHSKEYAKRRNQKATSEAEAILGRSKKKRAEDIKQLSKMPLSKLRQWQDLTERQIILAHAQGNTKATEALQARQNDLMAAVGRKEL